MTRERLSSIMAFVALLYFILRPVVDADEIISAVMIFLVTSAAAIGANIWLSFRLPVKNPVWKKVVLDYYEIKRDRIADTFFTSCMFIAIAIFVADYQVKLTNINNAQNLLDIGLDHIFKLYCFATVIVLIQSAIKNITDICFLFLLNRKVIAEEPE